MENKEQFILNTTYASWLGKVIGVRFGASIENWTKDQIQRAYGYLSTYPLSYKQVFAADDDTNGPLYFVDTFQFNKDIDDVKVGQQILNSVNEETGFFWWGGPDLSSEHRAYSNLVDGLQGKQCGSVATNGEMLANQIGGQIFSDCWGYCALGNIDLAMKWAKDAASVTHDQLGLDGAMFIAGCIACAMHENDAITVMKCVLNKLDSNSQYVKAIKEILDIHTTHPNNSNYCLDYIYKYHNYDCYPGACHIIPNSMIIAYALAYGNNDFSKTMRLCGNAGYDTDCNCGNVGSIMGMLVGLEGIDPFWIMPINDVLISSGSNGYLNNSYISSTVYKYLYYGYKASSQPLPAYLGNYQVNDDHQLSFALPYATYGFTTNSARYKASNVSNINGCLLVAFNDVIKDEIVELIYYSLYLPSDIYDARYQPQLTGKLYPGQTVSYTLDVFDRDLITLLCGKVLYTDGTSTIVPLIQIGNSYNLSLPKNDKVIHTVSLCFKANDRLLGQYVNIKHLSIDYNADYSIHFDQDSILDYGLDFGLLTHSGLLNAVVNKGQIDVKDRQLVIQDAMVTWGDYSASIKELSLEFTLTQGKEFIILFNVIGNVNHLMLKVSKDCVKAVLNGQEVLQTSEISSNYQKIVENTIIIKQSNGTIKAVYKGRELVITYPFDYGGFGVACGKDSCVTIKEITVQTQKPNKLI